MARMDNRILYVEDNPDDAMLATLAFRKAGAKTTIDLVPNGEQAIAALQQNLPSAPPACVLLDIKLPTMSGLQVLAWIRGQPALKRLPVVMLTSSLLQSDVNQAYDLGANSYLVKPSDLESLVALAKSIEHYWLHLNVKGAAP
jgi:CheY-like chemotaxis protein